jgi:hypothetical protein
MGRAFNLSIPASTPIVNEGIVPISVCGATLFQCQSDLQFAYDIADFQSNQFAVLASGTSSNQVLPIGSDKTILWVRQDPSAGLPETTLYVWTEIDYKEAY